MLKFDEYREFHQSLNILIGESYQKSMENTLITESGEIKMINEGIGSFLGNIFKGAVKIAGKMVTLDGYLSNNIKNAFSIRARILDYLGGKYEEILENMVIEKDKKNKNYSDPYSIKILFNKAEDAYTKNSGGDAYNDSSKSDKEDTQRLKKYWQNKILKIQSKFKDKLTPEDMNPLMKMSIKKSDEGKFKDVDKYLKKADEMDDESSSKSGDDSSSKSGEVSNFTLQWDGKSMDFYKVSNEFGYTMYLIKNDKGFKRPLKSPMKDNNIDEGEFTDIIALSNKDLSSEEIQKENISFFLYVINKTDENALCYNYNSNQKREIVLADDELKADKINNIFELFNDNKKITPIKDVKGVKFSKKTYYTKIAKLHDKIVSIKNK